MNTILLISDICTFFIFLFTVLIYILYSKRNSIYISLFNIKYLVIPLIILFISVITLSLLNGKFFYLLFIYLFLGLLIRKNILFVNKNSFYSMQIKIYFSQVKKIVILKDKKYFSIRIENCNNSNYIEISNLQISTKLNSFLKILMSHNLTYEINEMKI